MGQQDRAARTRRVIVETAAAVFDELGYEGASTTEILARCGLTRGALYFHFPSKEAIADAVVAAQAEALVPPERPVKLQAAIDLTLSFADRLQHDTVLRAAVRLTLGQASFKHPDALPYRSSADVIRGLLREAEAGGELLATVEPGEVAQLIVGSFTGIQLLSQVYDERRDLRYRVTKMWKYLLPGLAVPGLLPRLALSLSRETAPTGARVDDGPRVVSAAPSVPPVVPSVPPVCRAASSPAAVTRAPHPRIRRADDVAAARLPHRGPAV
ncbi:ScbR family autoregulator-binding transcription factor [Streptantibioticus ferralitis]|uniref:ScbR family autoregulator-binding transcription factor n=1 Tax=Streptantibioticus ferralitis TaxID=236510 RepID=A0ABT5YX01_9ACTN|nr:ScbR family autoregulator-binding transcription factor [Streptantibioticus ferralitis]MDF2256136.1 ScbR family autoregulator-binding transcription factor [Streptantibioticus ferralitis]